MKIWMLALWIVSQAHGFVLDHEHKKSRTVCGEQIQAITPLDESVARGQCEPFAQGGGRIVVYLDDNKVISGTGMLIAPDVVLTAAHVVEECLNQKNKCVFDVSVPSYAGKVNRIIPIAQTFVPNQFQELARRIQELKLANDSLKGPKNMGLDDSQARILSQNMIEIASYGNEKGAFDLALVQLGEKVNLASYLKIYPQNIKDKFKNTPQLFGVAVNNIKENKTGLEAARYSKPVRHIAVFAMDLLYKTTENPLVASFTLPSDYQQKCRVVEKGERGAYPDRFVYRFQLNSTPFLTAIVQPGDSGGPLISSVGGEYQIVGVAQQIKYDQCYDSSTQKLAPNGTFFNVWTPTFDHLNWLREKLTEMGADGYQEGLFN